MAGDYIPIREFKRNCELYRIRYELAHDRDGQKRIVLIAASREMRNIRYCLSIVLEQKPELEKRLIQELELKAANLAGR